MPFLEIEQVIKDSESRTEIKASMMHSGQMFWHPIKGTKLEVNVAWDLIQICSWSQNLK
jgi:hypothetical protein